jgi:hypothetical protein
MKESKYLPIGSIIANKYEVIDILGEDEFEILYLVRDINRKGSFFVLKELFLDTFSKREGELVFTVPEALGVFHKRKKQIIEEITTQKPQLLKNEIKVYGYEDENNTVYTIMEFSNNASLEKYLQFTPKDVKSLPVLEELLKKNKKPFNYLSFLKKLLFIALLLGIAFFAYWFFQQNRLEQDEYALKKPTSKNFPTLKERGTSVAKTEVQAHISTPSATTTVRQITPKKEEPLKKELSLKKELPLKKEENHPKIVTQTTKEPKEAMVATKPSVIEEKRSSKLENNQTHKPTEVARVEENRVKKETKVTQSKSVTEKKKVIEQKKLIEHRSVKEKKQPASLSINERLKAFLEKYTTALASQEGTLKFYDKRVKRYFKFKNPTHKTIARSQKIYNRKWTKRDFSIADFKIVKSYQKNGVGYYDLKTTTLWHIANRQGKKRSGKSEEKLTLKEVGDGFKIVSIY